MVQTRSRGRKSISHSVEDPMSTVSRYNSNFVPRVLSDLFAPFLLSRNTIVCFILQAFSLAGWWSDVERGPFVSRRCSRNPNFDHDLMKSYIPLYGSPVSRVSLGIRCDLRTQLYHHRSIVQLSWNIHIDAPCAWTTRPVPSRSYVSPQNYDTAPHQRVRYQMDKRVRTSPRGSPTSLWSGPSSLLWRPRMVRKVRSVKGIEPRAGANLNQGCGANCASCVVEWGKRLLLTSGVLNHWARRPSYHLGRHGRLGYIFYDFAVDIEGLVKVCRSHCMLSGFAGYLSPHSSSGAEGHVTEQFIRGKSGSFHRLPSFDCIAGSQFNARFLSLESYHLACLLIDFCRLNRRYPIPNNFRLVSPFNVLLHHLCKSTASTTTAEHTLVLI